MKTVILLLLCSVSQFALSQSNDSIKAHLERFLNREIISDSVAFYEGYVEALDYPRLAIRSVGDPGHLTWCEFYAYERYGVYLEMTGDIIIDNSIFDRNKGFNRVMKQRIRDSIPQWADSIGVVQENWIEFDRKIRGEFFALFDFEILSDSSARVTLIPERVGTSVFVDLDGIEITDARTKKRYDLDALVDGVLFEVRERDSTSYRGYMRPHFENCSNPNFICTGKLILPFTISSD